MGRPRAAEPSWGSVLVTTVRLWTQRRLGSWWPAQTRWRVAIVAALAAVIFVAGAAMAVLSGAAGPGRQEAGRPALAAAAVARQQAAAWVAGQVSADAIVACDPAMCAVLQARGVPAGRLLVLSPSRADPLGSDVVVATAAVRNQFGARLAAVYAPVTLAGFGGGGARIDVRAVAPDGGAAYRAQLAADVRDRRAAGAVLLHNHRIQAAGAAADLAGGRVDARLLVTLAALAALHPVDIVSFGGAGRGASAGVPLRSADIMAVTPARGAAHPASLQAMLGFFRAQRPPYLPPSLHTVRIAPGRTVLQIGYRVPCPLGLLGARS